MDEPSFLRNRLRKAKDAASGLAKARQAVQSPANRTVDRSDRQPEAAKPPQRKSHQPAKKTTQLPVRKNAQKLSRKKSGDETEPFFAEMADEAVIEAFARHTTRPEVLELVRPKLPAVLRAVLEGAVKPGIPGQADRQTLFRMLGLPWATHVVGIQQRGGAGEVAAIADRIATALARREAFGRVPVTVDAELVPETAGNLPVPAVAQAMQDHVRYSPAPEPVRPAAPAPRPAARPDPVDRGGEEPDPMAGW